MIRIFKDGIEIDEEGWHASNPRTGRGVEVFFHGQFKVTLTEKFLRQAVELLDWDRDRRAAEGKR